MLQITDVLTRNLINAPIQHDMSVITNRQTNYNILTEQMLNNLVNSIRSCGATFKVWADNMNTFECTSLMGEDKIKLLENFSEKTCKLSTRFLQKKSYHAILWSTSHAMQTDRLDELSLWYLYYVRSYSHAVEN